MILAPAFFLQVVFCKLSTNLDRFPAYDPPLNKYPCPTSHFASEEDEADWAQEIDAATAKDARKSLLTTGQRGDALASEHLLETLRRA
jgi:hypothetical protein